MGKTYTDFSQLSKGMFRKSDPVVEVKPLPPKKAAGDDALAYFGIGGTGNRERRNLEKIGFKCVSGNKHWKLDYANVRIPISKTPSDRRGAQNAATDIANRCF